MLPLHLGYCFITNKMLDQYFCNYMLPLVEYHGIVVLTI